MVLSCILLSCLAWYVQAQDKPFYLTLDAPPAPELSVQQALASFTIVPGFEVAPIAAEPLIEDPVAITWDEQGNLYVAEMRGFMPDAYGNNQTDPVGVVVKLTDKNADGQFDTREVLLDKLVLPRAIAIVNEGLLIGEPPYLWLCPSKTGRAEDIDCSAKRNLGSYGNQPGSVEHAENGLLLGLDNWLYNAKSDRRLQLHHGQLTVEPTLFRGQWGISQDNDGRLVYNTNSNLLLGDAYDAQQVVAAGNSGAPGLGERISSNDKLHAARINPGVNRAYVPGVLREDGRLNRPTSASGMAVYRGDQFGTEYAHDVFVTEPAANAVAQLRLSRNGLKITSEHIVYPHKRWEQVEFFASSDERFRPVDVQVGPDGALYVVDMYRGIVQDHVFLTEELRAQALDRQLDKSVGKGRIWRISKSALTTAPQSLNLAAKNSNSLVELLGHTNGWQRDAAQRLLLARKDRGLNRKLRSAIRNGNSLQAVHGIWTLSGRNALDRRTILRAMKRDDQSISLAALRAYGSRLTRADLLAFAEQSSDPVLVQQITFALAEHNTHPDVQQRLVELLTTHTQDTYHVSAIKAAAHQQELPFLQAMLRSNAWNSALEETTGFVQALVTQGFRAHSSDAHRLLDFVQSLTNEQRWLQIAALHGLFDVSRDTDFERAVLPAEHGIFATTDEMLWPSVARARRAFTWPGDELAANAKPLSPQQQRHRKLGAEYYIARCATCHGEDGKGIASLAPPLVGSLWVTGSSERLARILLQGLQGPIEVAGETWNGVMPGHAPMKDFTNQVAAGLMTYLHRAWGHSGRGINPGFVAQVRDQTANRAGLWTAAALDLIESNTHYRRYTGSYGRADFSLTFLYQNQQLAVKSAIFNGPMIEQKEDHFLFEPRQLRLEFVLQDSGEVSAVRMLTSEGAVELPRLEN